MACRNMLANRVRLAATAEHEHAAFAAGACNARAACTDAVCCTVVVCVLCTPLQERDAVLGSLARRAATLVAGLNQLEGVSCNAAEGALYAFPRYADAVVAHHTACTFHPCLWHKFRKASCCRHCTHSTYKHCWRQHSALQCGVTCMHLHTMLPVVCQRRLCACAVTCYCLQDNAASWRSSSSRGARQAS
jgi:hypothetical protein